MDDSQIERIADELDAAVTKDDAKLLIDYSGAPDEREGNCEVIANRKGYLRAGIELLRVGVFPLEPERMFVPIDLDYLTCVGGLRVGRLTRREDVEVELPPKPKNSTGAKFAAGGCFAVFIFLAVCTVVGFFHVLSWFFGK
ncbi:MAG: hypothetical protein ACLPHI_17070 [Terriglobales bacterium]